MSPRAGLPLMALLALLHGCAAGPDFTAPAPPEVPSFTRDPPPHETMGGVSPSDRPQLLRDDEGTPIDWWTRLGSDVINGLVERALAHSPTMDAAEASLRQANELAAAQRGAYLPSVQAAYAPTRGRVADVVSSPLSSGASMYTLHTAQLTVGFVPDVFGANARAVESLEAQAQAQAWQWRAARLTLAANVVTAALQLASLREQLALEDRVVEIGAQQLKVLQAQRRLGATAGAAVVAQEAQLRQNEAAAAALKKQLMQQHDLLAVLVGGFPADVPTPSLSLASLTLPDIPLELPARLVHIRPDVRVVEAQLHAANAQVGIAIANRLPQITLSANYGASAEAFSNLFNASNVLWNIGANVVQPVFQGGALLHRQRAAEAQYEQALAQYRTVVLTAFQNVADALEAARYDAEQYVAVSRQEAASEALVRITRRQRELGDTSYLTQLIAESAYLQAGLTRIQVLASRAIDTVALAQALGGGVWREGADALENPAER